MILRVVGELALVGDAKRSVACDLEIQSRFNEPAVASQQHSGNLKSGSTRAETQGEVGVTSPKACRQASAARGVTCVPATAIVAAARRPSVE